MVVVGGAPSGNHGRPGKTLGLMGHLKMDPPPLISSELPKYFEVAWETGLGSFFLAEWLAGFV